ncbi:MAG: EVE domain-containing protein [Verrucomicrobia bacterium]|nr:MAG: EVE domain-containing protein [Verrucomicrobiota bacterium]
MKNFWLVKQEPSDYSWADFVADGSTSWTGVRNFAARNNLRRMSKGDDVLFYHSGEGNLVPVKPLPRPVTLTQIKGKRELKDIALVRQSRLSVMPLSGKEFAFILRMAD